MADTLTARTRSSATLSDLATSSVASTPSSRSESRRVRPEPRTFASCPGRGVSTEVTWTGPAGSTGAPSQAAISATKSAGSSGARRMSGLRVVALVVDGGAPALERPGQVEFFTSRGYHVT
ncbi:MAG TPA: hypothetical protein VF584_20080 [Longimicrobium sp.]